MNISKELLEKAKSAKTAEELKELAKAEGMELTAGEAEKYFTDLHKTGELADDELDNVSGGWCVDPSPDGHATPSSKVVYLYTAGQPVEVIKGWSTKSAVVVKGFVYNSEYNAYYYPKYTVRYEDGTLEDVWQSDIKMS